MQYFAELDESNTVTRILVYGDEVTEAEVIVLMLGNWMRTCDHTSQGEHTGDDGEPDAGNAFRKNFAKIGDVYDPVRDAFISPKPYPSWVLDETTCCWEAPVERPVNVDMLRWDEETLSWTDT